MVILSRFPYPLEKGDKLRAFYQIKELSNDFEISLIALSDKQISQESKLKLQKYCSSIHILRLTNWSIFWNLTSCIFTSKPFQIGYFFSNQANKKISRIILQDEPEYIYCQLIRTTEYVKNYHSCPKTLDYMDALSKGIERRISISPWYSKWLFKIEAKRLKIYERTIFDYFENKTIITPQDRDIISHPEKKEIVCIPNGIDTSFFNAPVVETVYDIVFVGNLSYAPNIEAIDYLSNEILIQDPELTCLISGATPHPTVQRICKNNPQIKLQGWTEDIRIAYLKGRIFVAPMMIGTGMQNKLLEAMALGIPCITTNLANNAIKAVHGESILVANDKSEFITAIHSLLADSMLYHRISANGKMFVKNNYSWETSCKQLKELILNDN